MKRLLIILLFILLLIPFCFSQAFSSQSDSLTNFEARPFFLSTETGWDFFAVPDLFIGHRLGWAITNRFLINTGLYWAVFPTKDTTRITSADFRLLYTVYDGENIILQPFVHVTGNFGSVFYTSTSDTKCGTGYAVNPRADAMITLQNGFFYYLHPFNSTRFALTGKIQAGYAFAFSKYASVVKIKYGYDSIFSFDTHINMFSVLNDFLSVELQNKFSYNTKKGLTYSMSPMVYLFRNTPFVLSLGGHIPVQDSKYWSVSASISYAPPKKEAPQITGQTIPSQTDIAETKKLTYYFIFEQDSTDIFPDDIEYSTKNNTVINDILREIHEYGSCTIHIEGHANRADFSKDFEEEQSQELIPLSQKRVEEVKKALEERGIDPALITIESFGASRPVVSFYDSENSWKNRRVEITLTKTESITQ